MHHRFLAIVCLAVLWGACRTEAQQSCNASGTPTGCTSEETCCGDVYRGASCCPKSSLCIAYPAYPFYGCYPVPAYPRCGDTCRGDIDCESGGSRCGSCVTVYYKPVCVAVQDIHPSSNATHTIEAAGEEFFNFTVGTYEVAALYFPQPNQIDSIAWNGWPFYYDSCPVIAVGPSLYLSPVNALDASYWIAASHAARLDYFLGVSEYPSLVLHTKPKSIWANSIVLNEVLSFQLNFNAKIDGVADAFMVNVTTNSGDCSVIAALAYNTSDVGVSGVLTPPNASSSAVLYASPVKASQMIIIYPVSGSCVVQVEVQDVPSINFGAPIEFNLSSADNTWGNAVCASPEGACISKTWLGTFLWSPPAPPMAPSPPAALPESYCLVVTVNNFNAGCYVNLVGSRSSPFRSAQTDANNITEIRNSFSFQQFARVDVALGNVSFCSGTIVATSGWCKAAAPTASPTSVLIN